MIQIITMSILIMIIVELLIMTIQNSHTLKTYFMIIMSIL